MSLVHVSKKVFIPTSKELWFLSLLSSIEKTHNSEKKMYLL